MKLLLTTIALSLIIGSTLAHSADANVAVSVPRYGLFEVSFTCPDMTGNPFDPAVNDVWATLTGPRGKVRIPAFWDGNGVWKARFSPENVGTYNVSLSRNGVDETANAMTPTQILCTLSTDPGFVRASPPNANWQHFVFDNGTTYFPIGMDAAWGGGGVLDYPQLFPKMSQYHMNFARVWMTNWDGKAIDWPASGTAPALGTYLLDSAQKFDAVFAAAASSSVYVQMTLQYHGQFTKVVDPEWDSNPMNAQNPNGFLDGPNDFFTNARAITLTKAKYRYIVARYAWCTHLLGWELFNEIENDPELNETDYSAWHRTMCDYIRSIDPYRHLITTSFTDPSEKLAQDTSLDYYQPHAYPNDPSEFFRSQAGIKSAVPIFWGEFGSSGTQTRDVLHNGVWAGLMDPCAGAPQFWYWDIVQNNGWWDEFAAISAYISQCGVLRATESASVPAVVQTETRGPLNLIPGLGWQSEIGNGAVTVTPDGSEDGMQNIPASIQGQYHHDMMPNPITITTNFAMPVTLHVKILNISAAGAHLQVTVDGQQAADQDLPGTGTNRNVSIDHVVVIAAGRHSIGVLNTGNDWFTIDKIVFDGVAPGAAVMVRDIGGRYLFWANRVQGAPDAQLSATVSMALAKSPHYMVTYFDPSAGSVLGQRVKLTPLDGLVSLPITLSGNDIAGWITPTTQ